MFHLNDRLAGQVISQLLLLQKEEARKSKDYFTIFLFLLLKKKRASVLSPKSYPILLCISRYFLKSSFTRLET